MNIFLQGAGMLRILNLALLVSFSIGFPNKNSQFIFISVTNPLVQLLFSGGGNE